MVVLSCKEADDKGKSPFQDYLKEQHDYMLSDDSPLPKNAKATFLGLNYYPYDSTFCFKATYQEVVNGEIQPFKTNTDRMPVYVHKANLLFSYNDSTYSLRAFLPKDGTSKQLFVPFTDLTNSNDTYKSGRYLDLDIPDYNSILLDFNFAYNPYCAYNKKYSCPIPPVENALKIGIEAGEKRYH